jgi:hypothetical protein
MLAAFRGLYAGGTMAVLQVPSGGLVERVDGCIALAIGTALAAEGYALPVRRGYRSLQQEKCMSATSTKDSPWYIALADDKENARLIVSQIVVDTF